MTVDSIASAGTAGFCRPQGWLEWTSDMIADALLAGGTALCVALARDMLADTEHVGDIRDGATTGQDVRGPRVAEA